MKITIIAPDLFTSESRSLITHTSPLQLTKENVAKAMSTLMELEDDQDTIEYWSRFVLERDNHFEIWTQNSEIFLFT